MEIQTPFSIRVMAPSWPCSSGSGGSQLIDSLGGDDLAMDESSLFSAAAEKHSQWYWHNDHFDFIFVPIILQLHSIPSPVRATMGTRDIATGRVVNCGHLKPIGWNPRKPGSFRAWSHWGSHHEQSCQHLYNSRHPASQSILYRPRYIIDPICISFGFPPDDRRFLMYRFSFSSFLFHKEPLLMLRSSFQVTKDFI